MQNAILPTEATSVGRLIEQQIINIKRDEDVFGFFFFPRLEQESTAVLFSLFVYQNTSSFQRAIVNNI